MSTINWKKLPSAYGLHILLTCVGFTLALPFVWMVLTSLKPLKDVDSESWFPTPGADGRVRLLWSNYRDVFDTTRSTDVTGKIASVEPAAKGAATLAIIPDNGNETVVHTTDRKTRFTDPATGAPLLDAATGKPLLPGQLAEGQSLRVNRPAGEGVSRFAKSFDYRFTGSLSEEDRLSAGRAIEILARDKNR